MKRSTKIFLSITLLVAISDALFVTLNYYSSRNVLYNTLQDQGKAMEQAFELMLTSTEANMVQNAMLLATDPVVRQLFLRGKNAVSREGGGTGGKQAAAIRTELLNYVKPRWEPLTKHFAVRQLHFHFGPGSLSFLRVHKPGKFGDHMDDIRHTVVDSNQHVNATSGFEIGRVYSGIRGVVPVLTQNPETKEPVHIGALEAGDSFENLMKKFIKTYQVNVAILLYEKAVKGVVWPDRLNERLVSLGGDARYYIEYTSSPELVPMLQKTDINSLALSGSQATQINGHYYGLTSFPLRDYAGNQDSSRSNVGRIIVLRDDQKELTALWQEVSINIWYAILAFILFELILYLGMRWANAGLNREILFRTQEFEEANRLLIEEELARQIAQKERSKSEKERNAILDNIPSAISVKDKQGCYRHINASFEKFSGASRNTIIGKTDYDIFSSKTAEKIHHHDLQVLKGRSAHEFEETFFDLQAGSEYLCIKFPLFSSDGSTYALGTIFTDITELKQKEQQKLTEVKLQRDTLVREVHHRIKNHLQGISSLLANQGTKLDTPCSNLIKAAVANVNSIAVVHGLQTKNNEEHINLFLLMESIIQNMEKLYENKIDLITCSAQTCFQYITPDESVPLALVLNELLQNAIKHSMPSEDNELITVKIGCGQGASLVSMTNPGRPLPGDFDWESRTGLGTGLQLVSSLLPPNGAMLSFHSNELRVITELKLSEPVVISTNCSPSEGICRKTSCLQH